jgi:hypothetical protein
MTSPLLAQAVRNNALWCDAVCAAQGKAGEFADTLWFHRHGAPQFYPDAVTLRGAEAAAEQEEAIATLVRSRDGNWGIKDSYCAVDLAPHGFETLFKAEWIGLGADSAIGDEIGGLRWERIGTPEELDRWSKAWSGGDVHSPPIFSEPLLRNTAIVFLAAYSGDRMLGGGILNVQAQVVGHSNIFAVEGRERPVRAALIGEARRRFPGKAIVGYERGDELEDALALGFKGLGPLRVWVRG